MQQGKRLFPFYFIFNEYNYKNTWQHMALRLQNCHIYTVYHSIHTCFSTNTNIKIQFNPAFVLVVMIVDRDSYGISVQFLSVLVKLSVHSIRYNVVFVTFITKEL